MEEETRLSAGINASLIRQVKPFKQGADNDWLRIHVSPEGIAFQIAAVLWVEWEPLKSGFALK